VELLAERVEGVVTRLQETLQHVAPRIELSVDKELNQVIVRVLDKESGELIRQIPSEEVLELDRFFADLSGLFVEKEV
jgi:flagellar protein FlaG